MPRRPPVLEEIDLLVTMNATPGAFALPSVHSTNFLFRLVWRWHFWAGLLLSPFLMVVALTGAIYVFKDDIEDQRRSHLVYVHVASSELRPLDEQVASVRRQFPDARIGLITIPAGGHTTNRATMIQFQLPGQPLRIAYVNPYSAEVLGDDSLAVSRFFRIILSLHRQLMLGAIGRWLVELTTAWTVVLIVSGLYLWLPKSRKAAGVWFPRLRAHRYTILRDLHSIPGMYVSLIGIALSVSGLFFSPLWIQAYRALVGSQADYPASLNEPVTATSTPLNQSPVPLQRLVDAAHERFPRHRLMILPQRKDTDPYAVTINGTYGPTVVGTLFMDRSTGAIVADRRTVDLPFLSQVRLWVYPVHVGSVGGVTTKIIALMTCLILAAAGVTGVWMWQVRRRRGQTGFPHRPPEARVPFPAAGMILLLSVCFPIVGLSLVAVLSGEWVYGKLTRTG